MPLVTAAASTLDLLREHWEQVAASVSARDPVHGAWVRWCWPRRVQHHVVEVDAPLRERHT